MGIVWVTISLKIWDDLGVQIPTNLSKLGVLPQQLTLHTGSPGARTPHDTADAISIYTQNRMMPMFSSCDAPGGSVYMVTCNGGDPVE